MISMVRKARIMKVDEDFRKMVENIAKNNKISMTEATKDIAKTMSLMKGRKSLKKRIIEEVSF